MPDGTALGVVRAAIENVELALAKIENSNAHLHLEVAAESLNSAEREVTKDGATA